MTKSLVDDASMPPTLLVTKTSRVQAPSLLGYHISCKLPSGEVREVIRTEEDLRAFDQAVRASTGKDLDFPLKE